MRFRSFLQILLIWGMAASLSFLGFAIAFTTFFERGFRVENESIYRNHRFVGMAGTVQISSNEGFGVTTFGPDAMVVDKPLRDDVFRILFLGDSFVEARHVSDAEKFTEQLERRWNQRHSDRQVQSINLGLYGLDFPEWITFSENADRIYHPDLVILFVSWLDFVSRAELKSELASLQRPAPPPSTLQRRINASGVVPFLLHIRKQIRDLIKKNRIMVGWQPSPTLPTSADHSQAEIPIREQVGTLKEIFGDRLVIVFNSYPTSLGRSGRSLLDQQIADEIHALGVPLIDLFPDYKEAFLDYRPPFGFSNSLLGEGHLNVHGHQIVANAILRYLESANDLLKP